MTSVAGGFEGIHLSGFTVMCVRLIDVQAIEMRAKRGNRPEKGGYNG